MVTVGRLVFCVVLSGNFTCFYDVLCLVKVIFLDFYNKIFPKFISFRMMRAAGCASLAPKFPHFRINGLPRCQSKTIQEPLDEQKKPVNFLI